MTSIGIISVEIKAINMIELPRKRYFASAKPAMELIKTVAALSYSHDRTIHKIQAKIAFTECLLEMLEGIGCGHNLGGKLYRSLFVFREEITTHRTGKSHTTAATLNRL